MTQETRARLRGSRTRVAMGFSAFAALVPAAVLGQAGEGSIVFRDVRLFDGTEVHPITTVVVTGGRIESVGPGAEVPRGATVVEGAGLTLLPGLIDAHVHLGQGAVAARTLEQALIFGVTTALDMFSRPDVVGPLKDEQAATGAPARADVFSAGALATTAEGHGREFGGPFPEPVAGPEQAQQFVDDRIAEGSDYIKIVYDSYGSGSDSTVQRTTWRGRLPSIERATLGALIEAAHARDKLAIVHVLNYQSARHALEEGADGLAHLFVDDLPDPEFVQAAAQRRLFVIPTLSLLRGYTGLVEPTSLGDSSAVAYLPPMAEAMFRLTGTLADQMPDPAARLQRLTETTQRLIEGHVTLLAGTDAFGNPGTTPGLGLHEELSALVMAGLSPTAALAAATSNPAEVFGLDDRGRVEAGMRADLILVDGDPTTDIGVTREIVGVWKHGTPVDRASYRDRHAAARRAYETLQEPGLSLVADFESDGRWPTATVGTWAPYNDVRWGGRSTSTLRIAEGGANDTRKSLLIEGTIVANDPFAASGANYWPFGPVDLSSKSEIVFWAKGTGASYRVLLTTTGEAPATQNFVADQEWTEVTIPLSAYRGFDLARTVTIVFAGGGEPGQFSLWIDEVRIR